MPQLFGFLFQLLTAGWASCTSVSGYPAAYLCGPVLGEAVLAEFMTGAPQGQSSAVTTETTVISVGEPGADIPRGS